MDDDEFVDFDTRYPPEWVHDPSAVSGRMEIDEGVSLRETWEAMEELVGEGLVRNIGVCNMQSAMLRDLLSYAHIKPAVLQVQQITQQSSSPIGPNSSSYHILALDPKPATRIPKPSILKLSPKPATRNVTHVTMHETRNAKPATLKFLA